MGQTKRFEPTPEQRAMIERKIAQYIAGDSTDVARRVAAHAHVLPLCLDWTGCLALRPDGQILCIGYDDPEQSRVVEDERERNLGLFQGARRDPELLWLIPPRPVEPLPVPTAEARESFHSPRDTNISPSRLSATAAASDGFPPKASLMEPEHAAGVAGFRQNLATRIGGVSVGLLFSPNSACDGTIEGIVLVNILDKLGPVAALATSVAHFLHAEAEAGIQVNVGVHLCIGENGGIVSDSATVAGGGYVELGWVSGGHGPSH